VIGQALRIFPGHLIHFPACCVVKGEGWTEAHALCALLHVIHLGHSIPQLIMLFAQGVEGREDFVAFLTPGGPKLHHSRFVAAFAVLHEGVKLLVRPDTHHVRGNEARGWIRFDRRLWTTEVHHGQGGGLSDVRR